jgi:hypothetical protein
MLIVDVIIIMETYLSIFTSNSHAYDIYIYAFLGRCLHISIDLVLRRNVRAFPPSCTYNHHETSRRAVETLGLEDSCIYY